MNIDQKIHEAYARSNNYLELVQMLMDAGVESYTVDVATDIKLYRMHDHSTILHSEMKIPRAIADMIDVPRVVDIIRASQAQQISYAEFMPMIAAAGVRFYDAVLAGPDKRVSYIGIGGNYEERIPL